MIDGCVLMLGLNNELRQAQHDIVNLMAFRPRNQITPTQQNTIKTAWSPWACRRAARL